jgi:hypothetical protein
MVERLERLARQAQTGPWDELGEAWRAFAAELEADLVADERELLLKRRRLAERDRAQRISQEHAAARALVEEIARQIARRKPRAATFDLLAELLRGRATADDHDLERPDPLS